MKGKFTIERVRLPLPPCKDCEKRVPGCHAECEEYKTWRAKCYEIKSEDVERRRIDKYLMEKSHRYNVARAVDKQRRERR